MRSPRGHEVKHAIKITEASNQYPGWEQEYVCSKEIVTSPAWGKKQSSELAGVHSLWLLWLPWGQQVPVKLENKKEMVTIGESWDKEERRGKVMSPQDKGIHRGAGMRGHRDIERPW